MFSDERVFESTRIISEDEVPPEIREEIRRKEASHANTVTKILNANVETNVGALMSAARPKVDKVSDVKLEQRGASLAEKLINVAKAGEERRQERIRNKAKFLVDNVRGGIK